MTSSTFVLLLVFWSAAEADPAVAADPPKVEAPEPEAPGVEEDELPFTDPELDYLERLRDELRQEMTNQPSATQAAAAPSSLELKAEIYVKWLYRNNSRQGCVTYGNPHPRGDNFAGDNGACPELALTVIGRPLPRLEAGARLQSRYGLDFSDWFENGDKREVPDASSESLGQNHSAPVQLRGIYVRVAEPLPTIDWFLAGTSDLSYFDAFTIGRVRYTERFNAKGLFIKASPGGVVEVLLARIAMSKLFGTANYSGIEEPLLTNPFWTRDAVYGLQLATPKTLIDGVRLTINGALSLDEEADLSDPDAPGSTNTEDERDEVVATDSRFLGVNASVTLELTRFEFLRGKALLAFSHNDPNPGYVTNLSLGGLGFTNVVFDRVSDLAAVVRVELPDLLGEGRGLKAEYFNIGSDFNSVAGARREDDVLLTDGFLGGGQLPTLNLANELMDFSDEFVESIIGWHGATLLIEQQGDLLDASLEGTFIEYNTDAQGRDMDIYPGFGAFTGYTDTELFSYANTNDRGQDPRTVYRKNQGRRTLLFVAKGALKPDWWAGARFDLSGKVILDSDLRDEAFELDDYDGTILQAKASVSARPLEELSFELGGAVDYWIENGRSGSYAGGEPDFVDYQTTRLRPFLSASYSIGPLSARYHLELVKKMVDISQADLSYDTGVIWRSLGWLSAQF